MPAHRFISPTGPKEFTPNPNSNKTETTLAQAGLPDDVVFLESAAMLGDALQRKIELMPYQDADPAIVIYRNSLVEPQGILVPVNERSGDVDTAQPLKSTIVSFDLFSIPRSLLAPDRRAELAGKIEKIVNDFSQQPSATNAGPK